MRLASLVVLGMVLAACGAGNGTGTGGGSGGGTGTGGGTATGGGAATGGGSATGGGGSATGGGGSATGGGSGTGGGSAATMTVTGTVSAPTGQVVQGVSVILCVPTATGDCDTTLSWQFNATGATASTTFSFPDVPTRDYTVLAYKDVNANQTLDVGDWIGGWLDMSGTLKVVNTSTSGITFGLNVIPPAQSTTPAELVGYWSQTSRSYTIRADATYDWLSLYINYGSCITTDRMEVTQTGHLAVQGTSLTFTPTASTLKTTDCSGNVTTTHSVGATRTFTWRVGAGTSAATSLYLTDPTANPPSTDEFPKQ